MSAKSYSATGAVRHAVTRAKRAGLTPQSITGVDFCTRLSAASRTSERLGRALQNGAFGEFDRLRRADMHPDAIEA